MYKIYTKNGCVPPGYIKKFLLVMKITTFLLFAILMQVSASGLAQKLTLVKNNVTLRQIFLEINKQTSYNVIGAADEVNGDQTINANFKDAPIAEVLDKCLYNTQLTYVINGKTILIKKTELSKKQPVAVLADSTLYEGYIHDENGKPLIGATIHLKGATKQSVSVAPDGEFQRYGTQTSILVVTFVGYETKEVSLKGHDPRKPFIISMTTSSNNLNEVVVASNGYQEIPKERSTGAFEVISAKDLEHSSDPNLINRLQGLTTSMNFNSRDYATNSAVSGAATLPSNSPLAHLTIRGLNTLSQQTDGLLNNSGEVLVVIDGVASPYSIDEVNPEDVANVTVLKDAAAASIWGSRAANGVIVITTKKGRFNQPVSINFNANVTFQGKPDLFYTKEMSTSDYINAQIYQFQQSGTQVNPPTVSDGTQFYSPVALILGQEQNGQISSAEANAQLNALRGNDVRYDLEKYLLRDQITQSYNLALAGGSKTIAWRLSGGYDNIRANSVDAGNNRETLNFGGTYKPLKNLTLSTGIVYTVRNTQNQAPQNSITGAVSIPFYPYTRLVNSQGNPVSIPYTYTPAFVNLLATTYGDAIPSLTYTPLDELNDGSYAKTSYKSLNFNLGANYKITDYLNAQVNYSYNLNFGQSNTLYSQNSFYVRQLVTLFTDPSTLQHYLPNGDIYEPGSNNSTGQTVRGQLNFNKSWGKNEVDALAGVDVNSTSILIRQYGMVGYNPTTLTNSNSQVDFGDWKNLLFFDYNNYGYGKVGLIVNPAYYYSLINRTIGLFSDAAYTYDKRYTIFGSIRKDENSALGIGTNRTGTPFYSIGAAWNISNEAFYHIPWLPELKFRATFGYNGNVNPTVTGTQQIIYSASAQTNNLFSANPLDQNSATNNLLRAERTAETNLGLDFGFIGGRISGSVNYYDKITSDLISTAATDPSTGFNSLEFNTASLNGWGEELRLNTINIRTDKFSWSSSILFSHNREKVTKLFTGAAQTEYQAVNGYPSYNVGADLSRLYAYRWAGLDPANGNPRGYLNGKPYDVNTDQQFADVTNQPMAGARYLGSSVPVYFGSFGNTFRYKSFTLSAIIQYQLDWYFRRPLSNLVDYSDLFGPYSGYNQIQGAEYAQRWQKPGDELHTNVPSQAYGASSSRDQFYQFADINVENGNNVRLQEVNISYTFSKKTGFLKNSTLFFHASNLGILWRANKLGLDPDVNDVPIPKTYSIGFNANL